MTGTIPSYRRKFIMRECLICQFQFLQQKAISLPGTAIVKNMTKTGFQGIHIPAGNAHISAPKPKKMSHSRNWLWHSGFQPQSKSRSALL